MYKNIRNMLSSLKGKPLLAIIDEGRSRKSKEKCTISGIYNRIFTLNINNKIVSFSYSDLICKTIILKKI